VQYIYLLTVSSSAIANRSIANLFPSGTGSVSTVSQLKPGLLDARPRSMLEVALHIHPARSYSAVQTSGNLVQPGMYLLEVHSHISFSRASVSALGLTGFRPSRPLLLGTTCVLALPRNPGARVEACRYKVRMCYATRSPCGVGQQKIRCQARFKLL
jgi:hypothetical protein